MRIGIMAMQVFYLVMVQYLWIIMQEVKIIKATLEIWVKKDILIFQTKKKSLKDTIFTVQDIFNINLDKLNKNMLIYIDPPYKDTKQYNRQKFDTGKFWNLVREMSKRCIVVVSEYEAPNDFITIWEKDLLQNINRKSLDRPSFESQGTYQKRIIFMKKNIYLREKKYFFT